MNEAEEYRNHRLTPEEWRMVKKQRKKELETIISKPAPLKDLIHIVIPEHYGSKGVMWASRFVTEGELEGYVHQYPNMQILDEKYRIRRKEVEDEKT